MLTRRCKSLDRDRGPLHGRAGRRRVRRGEGPDATHHIGLGTELIAQAPRQDERRKDERRSRDERPAREAQGNDQRRNRRGNDRRSRHQDDSDEPTGNVVAFGDNVPAFLRIPEPVSRKAS